VGAAVAMQALALAFTGCLTGCLTGRTYSVNKTQIAPNVQTATLEDLLKKMSAQYAAVDTLNLKVNITPTEGGAHKGKVHDIPTFAGYILLRKPADLRVIMLLPYVRSEALDMVSNGKDFTLVIPSGNDRRAVVGSETSTKSAKGGLYDLRPNDVRVALQIPPVAPEEFVALTLSSRTLVAAHGNVGAIEEPDYDITVLRQKPGDPNPKALERVRVIHISRVTLQPYEQDLYDHDGQVVETIDYGNFQKFGEADYPMNIYIKRPVSEYTLQIDITKLTLNQTMDDEQFKLEIPEGIKVQKM
jgi:outer membrane lipoprotein-sorting protein